MTRINMCMYNHKSYTTITTPSKLLSAASHDHQTICDTTDPGTKTCNWHVFFLTTGGARADKHLLINLLNFLPDI